MDEKKAMKLVKEVINACGPGKRCSEGCAFFFTDGEGYHFCGFQNAAVEVPCRWEEEE